MFENIRPIRELGQNFLTSPEIAQKIIKEIEPAINDVIIEIGPGRGILTENFQLDNLKNLISIEIDQRLFSNLKKKLGDISNFKIYNMDFLEFSFSELNLGKRVKVIGNIPYNITSPIIFKLLENFQFISKVVLMVQKEVANRIAAKPETKDYGILSVMTALHGKVEIAFIVNRYNFKPVPRVDSAVIKIDLYNKISGLADYNLFCTIVKVCFNTRRKMLHNSLQKIISKDNILRLRSNMLTERPENLSVDEFKKLANEIYFQRSIEKI